MFFSEAKGQIKACAGVKLIVIPQSLAPELLSRDNIKSAIEDGLRPYLDSLNTKEAETIKEEIAHFDCIAHSRVATALHLRWYIERFIFSSVTTKVARCWLDGKSLGRRGLTAAKGAFNFWYAYTSWQFRVASIVESQMHEKYDVYGPHVSEEISKINDIGMSEIEPELRAKWMDAKYVAPEAFKVASAISADDLIARLNRRQSFRCYLPLLPALRILAKPRAAVRLARSLRAEPKSILRYLGKRLAPDGETARIGLGYLSADDEKDITFDAAVPQYGEASLKGGEYPHKSDEEKGIADLLWHMACRSAMKKVFQDQDMFASVYHPFCRKLRQFYKLWRPTVDEESLEDLAIADENATAGCPKSSPAQFASAFEMTAAELVKYGRFSQQSTRSALNCQYMHI